MPSLNSLGLLAIVIIDKDRTEVHIGKEESLVPIPPSQGEVQKEGKKPKVDKLTVAFEEKISIQTLVTFLVSTSPINSQAL